MLSLSLSLAGFGWCSWPVGAGVHHKMNECLQSAVCASQPVRERPLLKLFSCQREREGQPTYTARVQSQSSLAMGSNIVRIPHMLLISA